VKGRAKADTVLTRLGHAEAEGFETDAKPKTKNLPRDICLDPSQLLGEYVTDMYI